MERSYKTANGINIYDYRNTRIGGFSLSLFFSRGAMFETEAESGSSHLFEHMVFRHLNKLYGGELYKKLDSLGLSLDAITTYHYVQFEFSGAAAHFPDAARILSDILLPFELTGAEIKPEKERVKAEIRENGDATSLGYFCDKLVWENGALARSISGTAGSVEKFGVTALRSLQKKMLTAENTFIYATGNYTDGDIETLSALLEKHDLIHGETLECAVRLPKSFGNRPREAFIKNSTYTVVQMCFDIPLSAECLPAAYLLCDILFTGNTALIHDALSEKSGLVYSFNHCLDVYKNASTLYLMYEVRSDRLYKSVEEAIGVFASVGEKAEEYLRYALPEYTDNYALIEDAPSGLTAKFAYEGHILGLPYRSAEERKNAFAAVTAEDIRKLAASIFRPENLTLAIKANKKKTDTERLLRAVDILKH